MKMWVGARELCLQEHRNVLMPRIPKQWFGWKDRGEARAEKAWRTPNFFPCFIWIFLLSFLPFSLTNHILPAFTQSLPAAAASLHTITQRLHGIHSTCNNIMCALTIAPHFSQNSSSVLLILKPFKGSSWGKDSWKNHRLSLQYFWVLWIACEYNSWSCIRPKLWQNINT